MQWSEQGMVASYKFIQKFWSLHKKIISYKNNNNKHFNKNLEEFTNQILDTTQEEVSKKDDKKESLFKDGEDNISWDDI